MATGVRQKKPASPVGCEIAIENPGRYSGVGIRQLRPWLVRVADELAPEASSLAVRFVSDREMREVNHRFRDKDRSTDVLSFPGEEGLEGWHLGDICISIPTARRQGRGAGHGLAHELRVLLLHGVLHCLGYDHETDDGTMERLERRLRRRFLSDSTNATDQESPR